MDKKQLVESLGSGLFGGDDSKVIIRLDQPSVGVIANVDVEGAYDGFDWEQGAFVLEPSAPLVSWDYLEKVHPGIREQIQKEHRAYQNRPVRCIVAGSRSFGYGDGEWEQIEEQMRLLCCPPYITADKVEIVSGCARGVDSVAAEIAGELGYAVAEFPADWEIEGKAAGHIRNRRMAEYAAEDDSKWRARLLAFWDGESKGTANMIDTARALGLDVKVVRI